MDFSTACGLGHHQPNTALKTATSEGSCNDMWQVEVVNCCLSASSWLGGLFATIASTSHLVRRQLRHIAQPRAHARLVAEAAGLPHPLLQRRQHGWGDVYCQDVLHAAGLLRSKQQAGGSGGVMGSGGRWAGERTFRHTIPVSSLLCLPTWQQRTLHC